MDKILLIGMLTASAVDIGTTEFVLRMPGISEVNPLMKSRGVRITVNIATPIIIWKLTRGKSKKIQLAAALPYISAHVVAATLNYRTILKVKRKEER